MEDSIFDLFLEPFGRPRGRFGGGSEEAPDPSEEVGWVGITYEINLRVSGAMAASGEGAVRVVHSAEYLHSFDQDSTAFRNSLGNLDAGSIHPSVAAS